MSPFFVFICMQTAYFRCNWQSWSSFKTTRSCSRDTRKTLECWKCHSLSKEESSVIPNSWRRLSWINVPIKRWLFSSDDEWRLSDDVRNWASDRAGSGHHPRWDWSRPVSGEKEERCSGCFEAASLGSSMYLQSPPPATLDLLLDHFPSSSAEHDTHVTRV